MIEIKSSLLNSPEFKDVKKSLIEVSELDNKEQFRVKLLEYIDATSDNNDDMFFYDMMEFIRFLNPNDDAIAYTTPDKRIFLNSPGKPGENRRQWDFIYCHECLHQLWDTFGVAEKIKKSGVKFDHYVLNVASDCVINDYLEYTRKKEPFEGGITPAYLKETYGIDYDRKLDTQFTLYLKLIEITEKLKKDQKIQDAMDDMDGEEGQGQQGGSQGDGQDGEGQGDGQEGQGGNSQSGNGQSGKSGNQSGQNGNGDDKDLTADDAQTAADQAKAAADKAQEAADKAAKAASDNPTEENTEAAKKAQDAADKAKAAADKAAEEAQKSKECADKGDKEGEAEHAKKAKEAADQAKSASDEANGKKNSKSSGKGQGGQAGNDGEDLGEIKRKAEEIIEKYKNKLSGKLGEFLNKCKSSVKCEKSGLETNTTKGVASWNQQMNTYINAFVKKKVFQKKRQHESTYSRVKRGSGVIKYGDPIKPGRRIREEKMIINAAFYIDRSGSMGPCIENVFSAVFTIAEALQRHFKKEDVVEKCEFKTYAFDTRMREIPFGKTISSDGSTMDFDEILEFIDKNSKDYLINIIVTDANFSVNTAEVKKFLKNIPGLVIFVTNQDNKAVKAISEENDFKLKLNYILADSSFTIK
jgi:hypothetical protein